MASNLPAFPIENYQHEKILGKGGYGTVSLYKKKKSLMRYFESSSSQPKKVAVKIFLSNDAKEIEKFNKELVKAWARFFFGEFSLEFRKLVWGAKLTPRPQKNTPQDQ